VYSRDIRDSGKPDWQKDLYFDFLKPLIHAIDSNWPDEHDNWVVQVNAMKEGDLIKSHRDGDDICPQYAIGLGDYTGGLVETSQSKDYKNLKVQDIKHKVVKLDGRCFHKTTEIQCGVRFSIYFFKCYDLRFPKPQPILFPPLIVHEWCSWDSNDRIHSCGPRNLVDDTNDSMSAEEEARKRTRGEEACKQHHSELCNKQPEQEVQSNKRQRQAAADCLREHGGYVDIDGVETSTGKLRSCMQDALLNAAAQLGVAVDKVALFRTLPALARVNTSIQQLLDAPCVRESIEFSYVPRLLRMKGGPTHVLFNFKAGVFFVLATVHAKNNENHAFVYCADYHDKAHPLAVGAILCNRKDHPVRLLHASDRSTPESARNALDTFYYGNRVDILQVYRLHAKEKEGVP